MKPSIVFTPFRDRIINVFPKVILLGIISLFVHSLSAQNVDYNSRITSFYGSNCGNDGTFGGPEEHTWKGWISDNLNYAATTYSGCITRDVNGATTLNGSFAARNRTNVSATSIRYRIDGYEDDGGNRCTFDSGDDCRATNNCTYSLTNNINEYAYNSRSYTCGSSDYRLSAHYQYRYHSTTLANATEYIATSYNTSGTRPFWGSTGNWSYFGSDCATSGTITDNQYSSFSTTVSCKSEVRFWWRVSSEANNDFLKIYVNNVIKDSISGIGAWALKTIDLDTGVNVVEWRYVKNGSLSAGYDRGFVDSIAFVNATVLNPGTISGNQTICIGDDPLLLTNTDTPKVFSNTPAYQWEVSTDGGVNWLNVSLANALSYDPPALTTTSHYRRRTVDGCGNIGFSNLVLVTVNDTSASIDIVDVCNSYAWQGMTFTTSGMYYDTIPNAMGCDSLMSLNLTIRNQSSASLTATACDSYAWQGMTLIASGMYYDTIANVAGCDSLMSLNLTIRNQSSASFTATACDSYAWQGMTFTTSGMYYDTIPNAMGCDSLMSLNLTIRNQSSASLTATACDSYAWQGMTLIASGMYYDTIANVAGCDSLMSLNLTIRNQSSASFTATACDSYAWQGMTFTTSGMYYDTIPNAAGCDSLMSLNLTIRNQSSATFTATACDSYAWQGMTLIASGMFYDTIPNAAGCDSLMSLNLTIRNQSSATFTATACDSYAWQGMTLTTSGMYYDTIPNVAGCDSLMSLNLTIDHTTNSNTTVIACQSYTWQHNNISYNLSGIYTDTVINAAGCDSILMLNLSIDTINITITVAGDSLYANQQNASSYQWLDCNNSFAIIPGATSKGYKPTQSGSYAVNIISGSCQGNSVCNSILITGLEEKPAQSDFVIYPNPTRNEFTVSTKIKSFENYLQIYDTGGSLLKEVQMNTKETKVNVSNFAVGVYFIRFGNSFKKLIISN